MVWLAPVAIAARMRQQLAVLLSSAPPQELFSCPVPEATLLDRCQAHRLVLEVLRPEGGRLLEGKGFTGGAPATKSALLLCFAVLRIACALGSVVEYQNWRLVTVQHWRALLPILRHLQSMLHACLPYWRCTCEA
jgi:hypothetical protein